MRRCAQTIVSTEWAALSVPRRHPRLPTRCSTGGVATPSNNSFRTVRNQQNVPNCQLLLVVSFSNSSVAAPRNSTRFRFQICPVSVESRVDIGIVSSYVTRNEICRKIGTSASVIYNILSNRATNERQKWKEARELSSRRSVSPEFICSESKILAKSNRIS